jgi:membrane associated rhomboid family serine protease
MLLPIGDIPNPKSTPYVNWLLIGINVAIFLLITMPLSAARPDLADPALYRYLQALGISGNLPAQVIYDNITAYDLAVFKYAFRPAEPSLTSMFSAMFLHGGWLHLAGNMLFLWIYGDNVEHRLGHLGYLLAYLGAGLTATLFFGLFVPQSQVPMLGASGAISGVLGFYFLWFPRNQIKVFLFFFPLIMTTVLIPARLVLGVYLVVDNVLPFLFTSSEGGGVAYGAHIGGFLAGLSLAYAFDRLPGALHIRANTPKVNKQRSNLVNVVTEIVRAIDRDDLAHAASRYALLDGRAQRGQVATHNLLLIGAYLLDSGEPEQALTLYRRLIAERPGDIQLDRAYLGAGKALLHKVRCETSAYHYFLAAIDLAQSPDVAEDAREHLRMIEEMDKK